MLHSLRIFVILNFKAIFSKLEIWQLLHIISEISYQFAMTILGIVQHTKMHKMRNLFLILLKWGWEDAI